MKNHLSLSIYYKEEKRKGFLKFMHELQFSVLMPIAISLNILLLIEVSGLCISYTKPEAWLNFQLGKKK